MRELDAAGPILVDCRWLGRGGAGRATELLLRGLQEAAPPGDWVLWGSEAVEPFAWRDARLILNGHNPLSAAGQRDVLAIPRHAAGLFMHQIRPLRRGPAATLFHDTIPLRHGDTWWKRRLKERYFRVTAARSARLVTVSEFSRRSIINDLGVAPQDVALVRYPIDHQFVSRVEELRLRLPRRDTVLYVGRFAPHKNLPRLIEAFARSDFSRSGGELLLVGGRHDEVERLQWFVRDTRTRGVTCRGSCSDDELRELYATVACLVMPSLEEGFGLPAWEALSCGLPVCCSRTSALLEFGADGAFLFSPYDILEMADAIDAATRQDPITGRVQAHDVRRFATQLVAEMLRAHEAWHEGTRARRLSVMLARGAR